MPADKPRITFSHTSVWVLVAIVAIGMTIGPLTEPERPLTAARVRIWLTVTGVTMGLYALFLLWPRYQWIELDGEVLRAKRLITRKTVEWPLDTIVSIEPYLGLLRFKVFRDSMKQPDLGYEVRFRDGTR
ncbi:MAG TPA: hypothetical protein VGF55_31565, partial [Gemmataceae bacterium]